MLSFLMKMDSHQYWMEWVSGSWSVSSIECGRNYYPVLTGFNNSTVQFNDHSDCTWDMDITCLTITFSSSMNEHEVTCIRVCFLKCHWGKYADVKATGWSAKLLCGCFPSGNGRCTKWLPKSGETIFKAPVYQESSGHSQRYSCHVAAL